MADRRRWYLQRELFPTNAVSEGSMEGREGTESGGFIIPEGGQIVAVKWHKFGDVEVTFLVPDDVPVQAPVPNVWSHREFAEAMDREAGS